MDNGGTPRGYPHVPLRSGDGIVCHRRHEGGSAGRLAGHVRRLRHGADGLRGDRGDPPPPLRRPEDAAGRMGGMGKPEAGRERDCPRLLHTGARNVLPNLPVGEGSNSMPPIPSEAGASPRGAPLPQGGTDAGLLKGSNGHAGVARAPHRHGAPPEASSLLPKSVPAGGAVRDGQTPPDRETAGPDQTEQTCRRTLSTGETGGLDEEARPHHHGMLHLWG